MAVEIQLGSVGLTVGEWDEALVTLDMLAPGCPWTLMLHRGGRESVWQQILDAARVYAPIALKVDGAVQVRGVIRRRRTGADRRGCTLTISGTDYAGLAQIAEVPPGFSMRDTTLAEAIARLYRPLGIPVTVAAAATSARETQARMRPGSRGGSSARRAHHVDAVKATPGETIQQLADALCRRYGYLLYSGPHGDGVGLVIDRPAYDAPVRHRLTRRRVSADPERYAGNVVDAARDVDATRVHSRVSTFGHSGAASDSDARVRGTVENALLRSHPLVADAFYPVARYVKDKRARDPHVAEQRSRREIAREMAAFDVYSATTPSLSFEGLTWALNAMCRVEDDIERVHGDWLATRVEFSQARQTGVRTSLRLVPKNGLVIEPDPDT